MTLKAHFMVTEMMSTILYCIPTAKTQSISSCLLLIETHIRALPDSSTKSTTYSLSSWVSCALR